MKKVQKASDSVSKFVGSSVARFLLSSVLFGWIDNRTFGVMQIKADGITRLVVLPLYPQFSISTSGSSLRLLESIFRFVSSSMMVVNTTLTSQSCCPATSSKVCSR